METDTHRQMDGGQLPEGGREGGEKGGREGRKRILRSSTPSESIRHIALVQYLSPKPRV